MQSLLLLDEVAHKLYAKGPHGIAEVHGRPGGGTLCSAAIDALRTGGRAQESPSLLVVGYIDDQEGRVRLIGKTAHAEIAAAWGHPIDRRELESVALEREQQERMQFRRAVMMGDMDKVARLGPKRHWRF